MNANSKIGPIVFVAIAMILSLFVITSMLTGYSNSVGKFFKYLIPFALIYPFVSARKSIFLLIFISPFIDLFKRFLILFPGVAMSDLSMVLSMPMCLLAGLLVKVFIDCIFQPNHENIKFIKYFFLTSFLVAFATVGTAATFGGIGLKGIYMGLNSACYLYLIPLLPRFFSGTNEIVKLFFFMIFIFSVPALWCIKQGLFGLADFEYDYLRSGLTIEMRQLNEKVMRNFGTMVSASALSTCAAVMLGALIMPFSYKRLKISYFAPLNLLRLLGIVIFSVAIYYTFTRTAWVVFIAILLFGFMLNNRFVFLSLFFSGVISILSLYLSSPWILDQRLLNKWQALLFSKYGGSAATEQMLVLGTFNGRIESMAGVVTNKGGIWSPFGSLGGETFKDVTAHDFLSEFLFKYGYVPLFFVGIIGVFIVYKFFSLNFRLLPSAERNLGRVFFAFTVGLLITGLSHGAISSVFPVNLFIGFFLAFGIHLFVKAYTNQQSIKQVNV